ncbi:MAG TPA: alpha/beta hydrolase [Anaeromyxobacteraceae bacterium]|nr:alpha/beta hydrolase [Anaeromyxobacteraceae bacterium]
MREAGAGPAVLLLHGGWGYEAYPYDAAIAALAPRHRVLAPDRTGYGRSGRLAELPDGFHELMAEETALLLDALGVRSAAVWGHSDGAVVAAWLALLHPARVSALVLEALHHRRAKPGSLPFFETGRDQAEQFGAAVVEALRRDHGERWRDVLAAGARAWLRIIAGGLARGGDLYAGRLGELRCPVLVLHGRRDPRTEPGELDAALRALPPHARLELVEAGHSPHTSAREGARATAAAVAFLEAVDASPGA